MVQMKETWPYIFQIHFSEMKIVYGELQKLGHLLAVFKKNTYPT